MNDELQILQADTLKAITQAETETAMDIARRYPRDIKQVKEEVLSLATTDEDTAASCFYSKPVGKDQEGNETSATGESIRLAEIVAASYGNITFASRIISIDDSFITAQGVAVDIQKNIRYSVEIKRSIKTKKGYRFSANLIETTGKAASAIAIRDAIFKVIPKGFFAAEIKRIQQVAAGTIDKDGNQVDEKTLLERAKIAVQYFMNKGVPKERIFNTLRISKLEDVKEHHLIHLTGYKTALTQNEASINDIFPPTTAEQKETKDKQTSDDAKASIIPNKKEEPEESEKPQESSDEGANEVIDEYIKKFNYLGYKTDVILHYYEVDHKHSLTDENIQDMINKYDRYDKGTLSKSNIYPPIKK